MSSRILILINHEVNQLFLRGLGHRFLLKLLSMRIQVFTENLLLDVVDCVRIDAIRRFTERVTALFIPARIS